MFGCLLLADIRRVQSAPSSEPCHSWMEAIPLLGHLCAWTWPSGFSGTLLTPDRPAAHAVSFGQVPVHPFLGRQKGSVLQNKAMMAKLAHCRRFWKSQVSQTDVQVKQQPFIAWEHEN